MSIIKSFKYLAVECGYTHRLAKHAAKIQRYFEEEYSEVSPRLLYIEDYDFLQTYSEEPLDELRSKVKPTRGVIVIGYDSDSLGQAFALIQHLTSYGHCGFFDITTIISMEMIDGDILKICCDTESG